MKMPILTFREKENKFTISNIKQIHKTLNIAVE